MGWQLCFPLCMPVGRTSDYEDLSIGVIVGGGGADALAVCRALRGLPVGFLSFASSKLRVRLVP